MDGELETFVNFNTCNISINRGITGIRVKILSIKENDAKEIYF